MEELNDYFPFKLRKGKIMTLPENKPEKSKLSIIINGLRIFLKLLFPSYALIKMNSLLSKINKFYPNAWFKRQIKRNIIVISVLNSLFFAPLIFGALAINGNKEFRYFYTKAKENIQKLEFQNSSFFIKKAVTEKKFNAVIQIVSLSTLITIIISNFLIFGVHEISVNTKKLIKILRRERIIEEENKHPTVLWTEIGALIDITGSAPKEIASNERIWMALNIQVKDWVEDPNKRSLVFFKTTFTLKALYDFNLPKNYK